MTVITNHRVVLSAAFLIALILPFAKATVCNFDDLPVLPSSNPIGVIPAGYCGINWSGEGTGGFYFTGSFYEQGGNYYAHSQPNASWQSSSNYNYFNFISPAVFNGFWAVPNSSYYTNPNEVANQTQLQLQFMLYLKGNLVYTSPMASVPFPNGAFMSTGYSGAVDSVVIFSQQYLGLYSQYSGGGFYSIDDVTYNAICGTPTLAPSALQNFPTIGGTAVVAVTYTSGCAWTATSGVPWITVVSGESGTGNGSVTYQVAPNAGAGAPYREGSLTIAGLSLPIQQAGTVQFQATATTTGGAAGTTNVIQGTPLLYSGSAWPIDGGQITVQDSGNSIPSPAFYSPPSFSDSTHQVLFPSSSSPPCTDQLTATQGNLSQSVTLTGIYLGKVVLDDNNPGGYQVGKQFCQDKQFTSFEDLESIQVGLGQALELEAYGSNGGSIFFVNDQEATLTQSILIAINPGQTITLPLLNGRSSTVSSDATAPLPAGTFVAPEGALPITSLPLEEITGIYMFNGDLNSSTPVSLDNAALYVSGNVTINGGLSGVGGIIATGNISITGPVAIRPGVGAPLFIAGGNVSISEASATSLCSQINAIKASLGQQAGQPGYSAAADINGDGVVNALDLAILSQQLPAGTTCP